MVFFQVDFPLETGDWGVALEGGARMASLTLRQCLEQVMALGTEYVITEQGVEWTAAELLAELTRSHPTHLVLQPHLRC